MTSNASVVLGSRIREMRRSRGWSVQRLVNTARLPQPSRVAISEMENGRKRNCDVYLAAAIAHAFGVPLADLIDENVPPSALIAAAEIASARARLDEAVKS